VRASDGRCLSARSRARGAAVGQAAAVPSQRKAKHKIRKTNPIKSLFDNRLGSFGAFF
jgi:hypothetical protein